MSLTIPPAGRLSANDAAFNWMSAANQIAFTGCCGKPGNTLSADKNLTLEMLNDSFEYQAYSAMADSQDRITKENIKRSFSTFA